MRRKLKIIALLALTLTPILVCAGTILFLSSQIKEDPGGKIIHKYIKEQGIILIPGTKAYSRWMKGVLLGSHPEITTVGTQYVRTAEERTAVLSYAGRNLIWWPDRILSRFLEPEFQEPEIPEAPTPPATD